MADPIQIITHKGKTILFVDCQGLTPDQVVALFPAITRTAIEKRINLICNDVTGCRSSSEIKAAGAKSAQDVKEALGTLHSSIIGISGIQKIIAQAIVKDQYFAKNREDALDYLAAKA